MLILQMLILAVLFKLFNMQQDVRHLENSYTDCKCTDFFSPEDSNRLTGQNGKKIDLCIF